MNHSGSFWRAIGLLLYCAALFVVIGVPFILGLIVSPLVWGFRAGFDLADDYLNNMPEHIGRLRAKMNERVDP